MSVTWKESELPHELDVNILNFPQWAWSNPLDRVQWIHQTLNIWLGIQFRQRDGQIKDRKPNIFFFVVAWHYPETRGSRNLFYASSKSTHDWLMDGRVSDILMIFPLFSWKCKKGSSSRLGSKNQNKIFWRVFSSCMH